MNSLLRSLDLTENINWEKVFIVKKKNKTLPEYKENFKSHSKF